MEFIDKKIAFIVLTCDKYSDLWPMYIHFFEKNWADCPYDRYFVTNHENFQNSSISFINVGDDISWSNSLLKALSLLKEKYEYILITLEDLPIIDKVNQEKLSDIINMFVDIDGNFITLCNRPKPTIKLNKYFGIIEKGCRYRPTCVYSLWRISVLESLLIGTENAWEFEKYGAVRSNRFDNFFAVNNDVFKISNTVIKGKWLRSEYIKIKKLGFNPNLKQRSLFSLKEEIGFRLYVLIFKVVNFYFPFLLKKS